MLLYTFIIYLCLLFDYGFTQENNFGKIVQKCQKSFNVSDDQLKPVFEFTFIPDDENFKCLLACWIEDANIISKTEEIMIHEAVKLIKVLFITEDAQRKAQYIFAICSNQVYSPKSEHYSEKKCQKAYLMNVCFQEMAEKHELRNTDFRLDIPK